MIRKLVFFFCLIITILISSCGIQISNNSNKTPFLKSISKSDYIFIEAEQTNSDLQKWRIVKKGDKNYVKGASGKTYLEFMGNKPITGKPNSPLQYEFIAPKTGNFKLMLMSSKRLEGVKSDVIMPDRYSYIEVGERDYDNPLAYDKISPADYKVFEGYIDFEETISKSKARMSESAQLALIEENARWIKKRRDELDVTLNFEAYNAEIEKRKAETEKFDAIDAYDNKLNYRSLSNEIALMKQDTVLREKRKRWHKNLAKDIYVEEAVNVLEDLKISNIKAGKLADIKD